jgi:hypothetical protein
MGKSQPQQLVPWTWHVLLGLLECLTLAKYGWLSFGHQNHVGEKCLRISEKLLHREARISC